MEMRSIMKKLGCSHMEATHKRFLGDPDFYLEVVTEMLRDPAFEKLKKQIEERKVEESFDTAHMLKGIISNCDITPLYELIIQIVEPLRSGRADFEKLEEICNQMLCVKNELETSLTY